MSTILATVAARSPVGQGLSCFCPEIVSGGNDYSVFHFFGQLLDWLLEFGWVRGSEIEPANSEFHSFVRDQRQVERSGKYLVCQSTAFSPSATNLESVLGGICTKLVLWCFKSSQCFHDLTHVLLSHFPVASISGEGSFRVAPRLYCVAEWGCN